MNRNISNLTTGFVDLATYDNLEKHMYGGDESVSYFVRETRKSTWFTLVPTVLNRSSGVANFGNTFYADVSRSGDYLLNAWLRVKLPAIKVNTPATTSLTNDYTVSWTPNVGHNLIKECELTFNDLVAARFDSYHLDFWSEFTIPEGKNDGYNNMIGNVKTLVDARIEHPAYVINVPLPFFFTRNHGLALPVAAIPYNDMKIKIELREWNELITANYKKSGRPSFETQQTTPIVGSGSGELQSEPRLSEVNIWANYALVSNDERKKMACTPRDMVIEQVQTSPPVAFNPKMNPKNTFEIYLNHAIKLLYFSVRNTTIPTVWSNYTTTSGEVQGHTIHYPGSDPIGNTSISYVNTKRTAEMTSDYYSLIQPFYYAPRIPDRTGYHMYSYSLDSYSLDPMGSTNFGKLSNVSIGPNASSDAIFASGKGNVNNNSTHLSKGLTTSHQSFSETVQAHTINDSNGDFSASDAVLITMQSLNSNIQPGFQVTGTNIPPNTFIAGSITEVIINNVTYKQIQLNSGNHPQTAGGATNVQLSQSSTLTFTPVVEVLSTASFDASGTLTIGNESLTYTSKAGTRFFGVSRPNAELHDSGTAVTQSATQVTRHNQQYDFILTAVNHNIIRIAGGQLTFPNP